MRLTVVGPQPMMSPGMKRILDYLPPLYRDLLPPLFGKGIPAESRSTCRNCAMCRQPGQPAAPGVKYFRPDARCCTYYPSLPNYLAGALLADRSSKHEEGRRRVRGLLAHSAGAAPLALNAPPARERRYSRRGDRGFGRSRSLLCPYFRAGPNDCRIWAFRNGVCATYFCCPARGVHGAAFWEAVRRYLGVLEKALALYALQALGRPAGRGEGLRFAACEGAGSREALYRQAYAVVAALTPLQVARIAGQPGRAALKVVRATRQRMLSEVVPRRLRTTPGLYVRRHREEVLLQVPRHLVFSLPRAVWEAVRAFDGSRDRELTIGEVRRLRGLELTKSFLLALYRAGILEECKGRSLARRGSAG